jgi:hypothetical protein
MQTSNCPCESPIEYCSHKLLYANGVLSLTIGGCTDSIPLNIPGLSPSEVADALIKVIGLADPAIINALKQIITNVYNSLTKPSNQVFIDAINQAFEQGLIVLPPLTCKQITSVFAANGTDASGAFLLGADCKKYSAKLIAGLAQITPAQLTELLNDPTVINKITSVVNNQINNGTIVVPPPTLTCTSIGAAFTAAAVKPTLADVVLGKGCKSFTVGDIVALASVVTPTFPLSPTPPPSGTGFHANDGKSYTLAQLGESLTPQFTNTINATVTCPFVSALFVDSAAAVAPKTSFLAKGCKAFTVEGIAQATFTSQDPAVIAAAQTLVKSIVTCAYLDSLTPVSAATLTGTEEVKLNGCKSAKLSDIAKYTGANAPSDPANILPGTLPATVKVTCASLVAPPVVAAAAGDSLYGNGCKSFNLKMLRSAVLGVNLGYVAA